MELIGLKKRAVPIMILVAVGCIAMAVTETVIQPPYAVKSAVKVFIFLVLPLIFLKLTGETGIKKYFIPNKKGFIRSLAMGAAVYGAVMLAFILTRNVFDYSAITDSLSADQGVESRNFIWVASYICFGNSLLEEFMFRVVAFLRLSEYLPAKWTYLFSSVTFAVYHIAMLAGSFPLPMMILSLVGLTAGGLIFDYFDSKNNDVYNSWLIHIFADVAIMNIWYIML